MGKAAERRRRRRQIFLERLSQEDREKFVIEWGKRLESWGTEIRERGRKGQISGSPLFGIADYAIEILEECGPAAIALQHKTTTELLNNECCRALAYQVGSELYRMNQAWNAAHSHKLRHENAIKSQ